MRTAIQYMHLVVSFSLIFRSYTRALLASPKRRHLNYSLVISYDRFIMFYSGTGRDTGSAEEQGGGCTHRLPPRLQAHSYNKYKLEREQNVIIFFFQAKHFPFRRQIPVTFHTVPFEFSSLCNTLSFII
jgi:hypothetical protein